MRFASIALVVGVLGLSWAPPTAIAGGHRSVPVDCLPDAVAEWIAAEPDPEARFGGVSLPGIVLGVPGESPSVAGSTSVASLGFAGRVVVELRDVVIEDRPGPDFIVFENPYFVGPPPVAETDDYLIFAEPGIVEVSDDGANWVTFPYDPAALQEAAGRSIDRDLYRRLTGLAGLTPTFTGNWTVPDDPMAFDPSGDGGVSGSGGDAFDLATVGLDEARYVRITDADSRNGFAGSAEGFDLDALVVLHGRPVPPASPDRDGDGLADLAEERWYGSNPDAADTDGDGIDDGREVAGCRDPDGLSNDPYHVAVPRLWLTRNPVDPGCIEVRWTFLGSNLTYDLAQGDLQSLFASATSVDLGPTDCVADDHPAVRWSCDGAPPPSGGRFYVVRPGGTSEFGRSSALDPRESDSTCP